MKRSIRKKLILLVVMFGATIVTLTSTTFAWFATNRNAWLDKFELNIESPKSLLISVDGENFRTNIPSEVLKEAVVKKIVGEDTVVTQAVINEEFEKITLKPVTSIDLVNYKTISNNNIITVKDDHDIVTDKYYELIDADKYSYITFDLWFRLDTNAPDDDFNLQFVDQDYITNEASAENKVLSHVSGKDNRVYLYNALNTTGYEDTRTGTRADGTAYEKGKYVAGDTIDINGADALRLGVINVEENKTEIFEPSTGLGSYAIAGQTLAPYDPNQNAMFTYFNNIHEARLKPIEGDQELIEKYLNTNKSFDNNVSLGVFKNTNNKYNDIKLTVSLWLEGMDADYISGIYDTGITMFLNFCVKKKEI